MRYAFDAILNDEYTFNVYIGFSRYSGIDVILKPTEATLATKSWWVREFLHNYECWRKPKPPTDKYEKLLFDIECELGYYTRKSICVETGTVLDMVINTKSQKAVNEYIKKCLEIEYSDEKITFKRRVIKW